MRINLRRCNFYFDPYPQLRIVTGSLLKTQKDKKRRSKFDAYILSRKRNYDGGR